MKELFEFYLAEEGLPNPDHIKPDQPYLFSSIFTCMCLWYSLLYATCEGIEQQGQIQLISIAPKYDQAQGILRRFRNAMFHVQPTYWSAKLTDVLYNSDIPTVIREIHSQIGEWLRIEFKPFEEQTRNDNSQQKNQGDGRGVRSCFLQNRPCPA